MQALDSRIQELRREAEEDFVGLWQVARLVRECGCADGDAAGVIVRVVGILVEGGTIRIGQFHDGVFHEWDGDTGAQMERLRSALASPGRDPEVGEVAWLVA